MVVCMCNLQINFLVVIGVVMVVVDDCSCCWLLVVVLSTSWWPFYYLVVFGLFWSHRCWLLVKVDREIPCQFGGFLLFGYRF